jgi:hypothetical protein
MPPYTVMVDDNFHYMQKDERQEHGTFATVEEALQACRTLVDDWLAHNHQPGMTADKLIELYAFFGDDPFIVGGPPGTILFSGRDYARDRVAAICGEASS